MKETRSRTVQGEKTISKGYLDGKTREMRERFFIILRSFAIPNPKIFEEHYLHLLPHEKEEFSAWLIKQDKANRAAKALLNII